jgi:hypothetical protein
MTYPGILNICAYSSEKVMEFGDKSTVDTCQSIVDISASLPPGSYVTTNRACRFDYTGGGTGNDVYLNLPVSSNAGCWSMFWKPETNPTESSGVAAQLFMNGSNGGWVWHGDKKLGFCDFLGTTDYVYSTNTYDAASYSGKSSGNGWYWLRYTWDALLRVHWLDVYHYADPGPAWTIRETIKVQHPDLSGSASLRLGQQSGATTSKWMVTNIFVSRGFLQHVPIPTIRAYRPTGDGSTTSTYWNDSPDKGSGNEYQVIDEAAADDDSEYLECANTTAAYQQQTHTFPNSLLSGGETCIGAGIVGRGRRSGSSTGNGVRVGFTSTYYKQLNSPDVATYNFDPRYFLGEKPGGGVWDNTALDAAELYLAALTFGSTRAWRITQAILYIVVGSYSNPVSTDKWRIMQVA